MRTLSAVELDAVCGGDKWGYENSEGAVPAYLQAWAARSYQNSDGSWGPTETRTSFCFDVIIGGITATRCISADGQEGTNACVMAGPSAKIGGVGLGAEVGVCKETTKQFGPGGG
jgi:hypothetical protein